MHQLIGRSEILSIEMVSKQRYIRVANGGCECGYCTNVVTATGVTISNGPSPPAPPGPPPTPTCQDQLPFCPNGGWECQFLASQCQKSCGCCGANPPSYCSGSAVAASNPHSIFDEIKKLVCEYIANGVVESEAEQLICSRFSQVAMCDQIVKILWTELESACSSSVVV